MKMKQSLTVMLVLFWSASSFSYPSGSRPHDEDRTLPGHVQELIEWCDHVAPTLSQALTRALRQKRREQYTSALQILKSGMASALQERNRNLEEETLTGRMLRRGLNIITGELELHYPDISVLEFAESWVRFVTQTSIRVDRNHFIPYHHHWEHYCDSHTCEEWTENHRAVEMHAAYMDAIEGQLSLLERELLRNHAPIGGPAFYLSVVDQVLYEILSEDFNPERNVEIYSHACAASRLERVLSEISTAQCEYSNCSMSTDEVRQLIRWSNEEIRSARLSLHDRDNNRCHRTRERWDDRY